MKKVLLIAGLLIAGTAQAEEMKMTVAEAGTILRGLVALSAGFTPQCEKGQNCAAQQFKLADNVRSAAGHDIARLRLALAPFISTNEELKKQFCPYPFSCQLSEKEQKGAELSEKEKGQIREKIDALNAFAAEVKKLEQQVVTIDLHPISLDDLKVKENDQLAPSVIADLEKLHK